MYILPPLSFSLQGKDVELLVLAVEESVTNVIHHGLADNPEHYTLTCRSLPASMEMVIGVKGIPFQVDAAPGYQPDNVKNNGDTAGLGMYLLQQR